jgi:Glycosyl hydrolases family 18/Cellulose binding domain
MLRKISTFLTCLVLAACSGGGSNASYTPSGTNSMGAVVATGAPLANVPYTITRLIDNAVVSSGTVGLDAYLQAQVSQTDAPFIVKVTDTGVTPNVEHENLALPSDFGSDGKVNMNVTPISTIVTKIVRGQLGDLSKTTVAELTTQRAAAADVVKTALQPLLDAANASVASGTDLITKVFIPVSDPLDKVLDTIQVDCTSGTTCTITPTNAKAASTNGVMSINTSSVADANASASKVKTTLDSAKTDMMSTGPVVVVFGSGGAWGTANDAWAGYTGKFTIYNFTDQAIDGNAVLYFESSKLKQNGFWDVTATVSNDKFSLTLPSWGNIPPKTNNTLKPSSYTFGFNGSGVPSAVTDISACNINGRKCLVLIDDGTLDVSAANSSEVKVRSWSNFLSTLPTTVSNSTVKTDTKTLPPPSNTSTSETVQSAQQETTSNTGTAKIALLSTSSWSDGFNGELQLTNTSGAKWTSWKVTFTKPSSINAIGGWGNYKISSAGNSYTFENESWNGALEMGKMIKLGFGGSGSLGSADVPTNCTISVNGGATVACTSATQTVAVTTNQPTGSNTSSTTAAAPVPPAPPAPTVTSPTSSANSSGSSASAGSNISAAVEPATVEGSVKANQTKRVYVGYYPSWSDNWFSSKNWNGTALSDDEILKASKLARIPGTYTHVVVAFAQPNFSYSTSANFTANAWSGTGLNFNAGPQDIRRAVDVLHARGMKVLVAVGGATYNNWAALAAENGSATGTITNSLKQMMIDMDFDGLDVDYEVDGTNTAEYTGAVNAMRKAVDLANTSDGQSRWLTVAGWSTGADPAGTYWGGKSGGERLVFSQPGMADKINMVSIMSYDARFEHYDGVKAWQYYRDLFPSTTIVNIGLETAPEGWAGGMLVVEDADAQCDGSKILANQAGESVNLPYSVNRYAGAVKSSHPKSNARDGAMIWQVLKTATAACGTATLASPGTIATKISNLYGLPADPRAAWK